MTNQVIKSGRLDLGKVDYNGSGRRNCKAVLTFELRQTTKGIEFSACGEVWNPRETDIYMGGQCVDTVAAYFPHDRRAQRLVELWRLYHLNGMTAGSPAQMQCLAEHAGLFPGYPVSHYDWARTVLAQYGLDPDSDANGYRYGHAWLFSAIPDAIIDEIKAW